jgi:sulfatase maturation enzyme AslB (radical SAM superfamily)
MYVQTTSIKEIFQSKFMKALREQFRNNERPTACQTCWVEEDAGNESKRIKKNKDLPFNIAHGFQISTWEHEPESPMELQLIISNACNLKCRSCSPSHSSQWQAERKAITGINPYEMPYGQAGHSTSKLWVERFDWYKNLRHLEIVGGEPFYINQWEQMLRELITINQATQITLDFSTNCTVYPESLIELLCKNFKQVNINLSIDGTGSVYEYLRHPAEWDIVYANMQRYHLLLDEFTNLKIRIGMTLGWMNALNLRELYSLCRLEFSKFGFNISLIHSPEFQAIWAVPTSAKHKIVSHWDCSSDLAALTNGAKQFMFSRKTTPSEFKAALLSIETLDHYRNENVFTAIPELTALLNEY